MPLSGSDLLFWVAGLVGHILLLGVLIGRGRVRQFPMFTAMIASSIVRTVVLYFALKYGSAYTYFRAYLGMGFVDVALQCAVVYEVASHVFRPLGRWAPDVRSGLRALVAGSLAIASGLTWLAGPVAPKWQMTLLLKGNFFSSTLFGELFLGLVVLSVTVGLPWRTHVARISQGLGAYSILDILVETGHTLYGAAYQARIDDVLTGARMFFYLGALVYWTVTLWQEAPQTRHVTPEMQEQLRNLQARVAYDLYTIRNWRKP